LETAFDVCVALINEELEQALIHLIGKLDFWILFANTVQDHLLDINPRERGSEMIDVVKLVIAAKVLIAVRLRQFEYQCLGFVVATVYRCFGHRWYLPSMNLAYELERSEKADQAVSPPVTRCIILYVSLLKSALEDFFRNILT
jgi:hypothetical protein